MEGCYEVAVREIAIMRTQIESFTRAQCVLETAFAALGEDAASSSGMG